MFHLYSFAYSTQLLEWVFVLLCFFYFTYYNVSIHVAACFRTSILVPCFGYLFLLYSVSDYDFWLAEVMYSMSSCSQYLLWKSNNNRHIMSIGDLMTQKELQHVCDLGIHELLTRSHTCSWKVRPSFQPSPTVCYLSIYIHSNPLHGIFSLWKLMKLYHLTRVKSEINVPKSPKQKKT